MQRVLLALVIVAVAAQSGWAQATLQNAAHTTVTAPASGEASEAAPRAETEDARNNLAELTAIHERSVEALNRMATIYDALNARVEAICGTDRKDIWSSEDTDRLEHACRTSAHDMLEYAELEGWMYSESLRFTALRTAMETQRDSTGSPMQ